MKKNQEPGLKLSQNEKGQLMGGFELQTNHNVKTQLNADNYNCKGGGWFDTNTNCNRCSDCDQHASTNRDDNIQIEP